MHHYADKLSFSATKVTPSFYYEPETKALDISGQSYPEDAAAFYEPVCAHLHELFEKTKDNFTLRLMLDYFNTSSGKYLQRILQMLEKESQAGRGVKVFWYYDQKDPDQQENGLELCHGLSLNFELIGVDR